MRPSECEFESDVLCAVLQERWPARTDANLVAHVASCAICSDIAVIAEAIEASRDEMGAPVSIPDSGRVWWVAQRRARLEAAEMANRPIQATQLVALVCAVVVLCACFGAVGSRLLSSVERIAAGSGAFDLTARFAAAASLLAEHAGLALAMAAVLLLVPVAAFLAIARE